MEQLTLKKTAEYGSRIFGSSPFSVPGRCENVSFLCVCKDICSSFDSVDTGTRAEDFVDDMVQNMAPLYFHFLKLPHKRITVLIVSEKITVCLWIQVVE